MSFRLALCAVMLCLIPSVVLANPGMLEVGVSAGWLDFDDEIRFEDDMAVSIHVVAELLPSWSLGMEFTRVGARDDERGIWQDIVIMSIRSRFEPLQSGRLRAGGVFGVAFMAFENQPHIDSISEGFEGGPSVGWGLGSDWRLRGEMLLRVQTVSRFPLDDTGQVVGDVQETGYLWSREMRVGVSRGF